MTRISVELERTGAALAEALREASYDEPTIGGLARLGEGLSPAQAYAALRLRPVAETRLALLVRLFLGNEELDEELVAAAVAPARVPDLEQAGLLRRRARRVRSPVRIGPFRGALVVSDPPRFGRRVAASHVLYPGPVSEQLAALTIRRSVGRVLDVGCGSGAQAFAAAGHGRRVVGTDVNPRALRLARLGAVLNGVENVEWRRGDLYEPVADEQFDLIVSNPPFVVSPTDLVAFRDGLRERDEVSRDVVRGAGVRLAPDGYAHVLCAWVVEPGEEWAAAPRRWVDALDCDAILLRFAVEDAVSYAVRWSAGIAFPRRAVDEAARWLEEYRREGIEHVATGAVVLHRGAGPRWVHAEEAFGVRGDAGAQLEQIVAGNDLLASQGRRLAELRLALAPGVRVVRRYKAGGGLEHARVTRSEGITLPGRIPDALAHVLLALDGRATFAEAAQAQGIDPDPLLSSLREVVARGFVRRAGSAPAPLTPAATSRRP